MNNFELKIVGTDQEYAQAMDVRRQVFVEELAIPEQEDYDGNDHSASHVLALDNGKPAGTMRIRYFNGFVKFERMCVLPPYRKTDLSEQIMRYGMAFAATKGYDKVCGLCKKELLPRWKKDGFEPVPDAPPVKQNGMILIRVCCTLPPVENCITINTPSEILNAKEGAWQFSPKQLMKEQLKSGISDMLNRVRLLRRPTEIKIDPKTVRYDGRNLSREY